MSMKSGTPSHLTHNKELNSCAHVIDIKNEVESRLINAQLHRHKTTKAGMNHYLLVSVIRVGLFIHVN